eukprot:scaffold11525_cov135-Cylindrotheca_fusiformis.AAC.11
MSTVATAQEEKDLDVPPDLQDGGKDFDPRSIAQNGVGKFDYRLEPDMYDDKDDGMSQSLGIELGYLPPEQRPGIPGELLAQLVDPEIDDDTEAAEALRANANVKVGKVGKVARSLNAQSVRKLVKRATLRGQSGNRRGKPPRIPPGITSAAANDKDVGDNDLNGNNDESSMAMGESKHGMAGNDAFLKESNIKKQDSVDTYKVQSHHARRRDEHSGSSAANETENKSKKESASNLDETKDIPVEVVAATMETGRKLMGDIDPHNMLQLQRWRRKNKKGKKKKRKSYVKGKVIDGRHELYTLSIAVMLGVRTSIAKTNTIIANTTRSNALTAQDFMAEEKYEFAPKGSATTPPHKLSHTFKFKDYAPLAFAYLRRMFGVNEFDFLLSVCGNANFIEFISNAKSGQFFFYSSDGKYMIKTMTNAESKFLRRRSELGREAKPGQDVLKDNDLRKILPQEAFSFHPKVRERVRQQVVSDCSFLSKMQIMDYSMLIGVHHTPPKQGDRRGSVDDSGFHINGAKERQISNRGSKNQVNQNTDPLSVANQAETEEDSVFFRPAGPKSSEQSKPQTKDTRTDKGGTETRRSIKEIRESPPGPGHAVKNYEFAGLLDEEDDCSYLEGSTPFLNHDSALNLARYQQHPSYDDVELKKEQTIEQIYWPFHRFYDIDGLRRMKPKECFRCGEHPCTCEGHMKLAKAWNIPEFTPPLSNRKDGGLMMDTSGQTQPMVLHGPQGDRLYEGKIFYMGIIDILQQYNARKRVETSVRKMENNGGLEPSCVSPDDYAERFIAFFDEYSRTAAKPTNVDERTEIETTIVEKPTVDSVQIDVKARNA